MKSLYESLLDDFDDMASKVDTIGLKSQVIKFILDNYYCHPNCLDITGPENGIFYVSCKKRNVSIEIRNENATSLTNGIFVWDKVDGNFGCGQSQITSLEGAPKEVGGSFDCQRCGKLTSLEGAPKKVGGSFDCRFCHNLTSLEGAPKEVMSHFNCDYCGKLDSLKGAPKVVAGDFYCGKKFSTNDVKKVSKVKGHIGYIRVN